MAEIAPRFASPPRDLALESRLFDLDEVGPELLARRALLRRTDSKFVAALELLPDLTVGLRDHYGLLRASGRCLASYRTLYFDTPGLRCFHDHRRGVRPRHKVRVRHYLDRQVSYLEIKRKRSDRITSKTRRQRVFGDDHLDGDDRQFVADSSGLPAAAMRAAVWTDFSRITLVGLRSSERVTIDLGLTFRWLGAARKLGGLMIVEVKQAHYSSKTPVMLALKRAGLRPASASKYCAGIAWSRPNVRLNRLRPALRAMERIAG